MQQLMMDNPDIDDTGFITASSTDTLTNKTLTAPKIAMQVLLQMQMETNKLYFKQHLQQ